MELSGLSIEEKVLRSHIFDLLSAAKSGQNRFDGFFNPRERAIAQTVLDGERYPSYAFYGGRRDAERTMLGVFSVGELPPEERYAETFPIVCLSFGFPTSIVLSHRDFLGASMNLMIKRETIGDIIVGDGKCVLFATAPAAHILESELTKVGNVGVKCDVTALGGVDIPGRFSELGGTVSSMRLDCVLALLLRGSRATVQQLIKSGNVTLNHAMQQSPAKNVSPGDVISVRGYGRFLVEAAGGMSRKGRIKISCKKYL